GDGRSHRRRRSAGTHGVAGGRRGRCHLSRRRGLAHARHDRRCRDRGRRGGRRLPRIVAARGGSRRCDRSAAPTRAARHERYHRELREMTGVDAVRDTARSRALMARAREIFPGGVSSPVRAFGGVGGEPFVVERGSGARIWDVDGNEYIDYVLSWGPLVLGHADPSVLDALREVMERGTSFGIPTGLPNSPGVPDALAALTLTAQFNDVQGVEEILRRHPEQVAAIIVEPVIGNAGFIRPDPAFLPALRRLADEHGALLIFDEVMTGF